MRFILKCAVRWGTTSSTVLYPLDHATAWRRASACVSRHCSGINEPFAPGPGVIGDFVSGMTCPCTQNQSKLKVRPIVCACPKNFGFHVGRQMLLVKEHYWPVNTFEYYGGPENGRSICYVGFDRALLRLRLVPYHRKQVWRPLSLASGQKADDKKRHVLPHKLSYCPMNDITPWIWIVFSWLVLGLED